MTTAITSTPKRVALPPLAPPHPYFGNKHEIADQIWDALGDVPNFVDALCGSCSILYARPTSSHERPVETLNDAWGFIPNFLRAVAAAPDEVAHYADWPVSELDMHARHRWLLKRVDRAFVERLREDESFFDARVAGYFIWGQAIWIRSGWCVPGNVPTHNLPHLTGQGPKEANQSPNYGKGIFRKQLLDPEAVAALAASDSRHAIPAEVLRHLGDHPSRLDVLRVYFRLFAARLEFARIVCGDYKRVLSPAVTFSHGLTGIVLDPPYGHAAKRTRGLYAADSLDIAAEARAWAAENGANPLLRIVLCGYVGEHEELEKLGWSAVPWKARGGYANETDAKAGRTGKDTVKERLWLSPHCIGGAKYLGPLFNG